MAITVTSPNDTRLTYNDEWDVVHYPIKPQHLEAMDLVVDIMGARDGRWLYTTTIHGAVLRFIGTTGAFLAYNSRMDVRKMNRLMAIPGFRWVECAEGTFSVGVEH